MLRQKEFSADNYSDPGDTEGSVSAFEDGSDQSTPDLDTQYEREYRAWRKHLHETHCRGRSPQFAGNPCQFMDPDTRLCGMTNPLLGTRPSGEGRCVREIVYRVVSHLQGARYANQTANINEEEIVAKAHETACTLRQSPRAARMKSVPGDVGISIIVAWIETVVKRRLRGNKGRRTCGNCAHYVPVSRQCRLHPDKPAASTTRVLRQRCRECSYFADKPPRCALPGTTKSIAADSPLCERGLLKAAAPVCGSCSYFSHTRRQCSRNRALPIKRTSKMCRQGSVRRPGLRRVCENCVNVEVVDAPSCSRDATRTVTRDTPMCPDANIRPYVLCSDFQWRMPAEEPGVAEDVAAAEGERTSFTGASSSFYCAQDKKADLKDALLKLEHWFGETGLTPGRQAIRARCRDLLEIRLDNLGDPLPRDHEYWTKHNVTPQTVRNDLRRIKAVVTSD